MALGYGERIAVHLAVAAGGEDVQLEVHAQVARAFDQRPFGAVLRLHVVAKVAVGELRHQLVVRLRAVGERVVLDKDLLDAVQPLARAQHVGLCALDIELQQIDVAGY